MKKRQFYTLLWVIILWFWILYYQTNRILSYERALELRQIDIYKDTWNTDNILNDLEEIKWKLNASWRVLANNPTLNPENYTE